MPRIASIRATALIVPMNEPFEIAGGSSTRVENVLIELKLADGTLGYGECAPLPAFNGETMTDVLAALRRKTHALVGEPVSSFERLSRRIKEQFDGQGSARAGLEMAALDAWAQTRRLALFRYFGGRQTSVATDVTVTIVEPKTALAAARKIARMGINTIKIKVGKDLDDDERRVHAVVEGAPKARLILDGNQGYGAREALALLKRLRSRAVEPVLFEQPVSKRDWNGLAKVLRDGKIAVAADESVSSKEDALRMVQARAVSVVNIKLMKYGIGEALEVARIARAGGLGLMIGGMIESRLAMTCAAHVAAGTGGFQFVDLDTPLWFARDPMKGLKMKRGGVYDLSRVRAGIGVAPVNNAGRGTQKK